MTGERTDPLALKFSAPRYFEDFAAGERFYLPSRTMTESVFPAFQAASGDNHPIHYHRHPAIPAPAAAIPGAEYFPHAQRLESRQFGRQE